MRPPSDYWSDEESIKRLERNIDGYIQGKSIRWGNRFTAFFRPKKFYLGMITAICVNWYECGQRNPDHDLPIDAIDKIKERW